MGCLSSSWAGGRCCPLAARGYSRDAKMGLPQIEYGLLTDPAGRPVAVRVFPGNTADPTAFTAIVQAVNDTFAFTRDQDQITAEAALDGRHSGHWWMVPSNRERRGGKGVSGWALWWRRR